MGGSGEMWFTEKEREASLERKTTLPSAPLEHAGSSRLQGPCLIHLFHLPEPSPPELQFTETHHPLAVPKDPGIPRPTHPPVKTTAAPWVSLFVPSCVLPQGMHSVLRLASSESGSVRHTPGASKETKTLCHHQDIWGAGPIPQCKVHSTTSGMLLLLRSCPTGKHRDLRLDPQHSHTNPGLAVHVCNTRIGDRNRRIQSA